ncbi:MAG: hypothetical protein VYE77_08810 [Planctomycetota bacterium]|nr:hypothetical protein [Planctomycetota bacterium]
MIRFGQRTERYALAGLLLAATLCCTVLTWSTWELESVNDRRREQLQLLWEIAGDPAERALGPVAELDGLFGCRVALVAREHESLLSFVALPEGSR